jgi:hypothetical protein
MRIHNQKELLEFWEQVHGKLKEELKKAVMNNSTIKQILTFDSDHIKVAIKRNAELNDVLRDLQDQTKRKEEFDRKQNPFYDANYCAEPSSKIEKREQEGGRWGRSI